jgi:RNA-directed DNA polymerase
MKRYNGLWDQVVAWENLLLAAQKARRGKRRRGNVQEFEFHQEAELLRLKDELTRGTYRPGVFRSHWITQPKPRLISAAPYRDRVVHHALMNVLEPILDKHFHPFSYACRRGKGTHAAADRLQRLMGHFHYFVQCDIRKYFPSIDHGILKNLFRRLIKDARLLGLMDLVVDHSNKQENAVVYFPGDDLFTPFERRRGLPIGNLTSQWFANWYLTPLDHYVTCDLGLRGYVRYCDDFVLLGSDSTALLRSTRAICDHLSSIRLRLKGDNVGVIPVQAGATFVGYRLWSTHRLIRKPNVRRFRRRVRWMQRAYALGWLEWAQIKPRLDSWIAHARKANSQRLLRRISTDWRFLRA